MGSTGTEMPPGPSSTSRPLYHWQLVWWLNLVNGICPQKLQFFTQSDHWAVLETFVCHGGKKTPQKLKNGWEGGTRALIVSFVMVTTQKWENTLRTVRSFDFIWAYIFAGPSSRVEGHLSLYIMDISVNFSLCMSSTLKL